MRLIDADALLTERKKSKYYHLPNGDVAIPIIDIEHAPTVEVERTGKWILWGGMDIPENHGRHKCSECREFALRWYDKPIMREHLSDFCPHCGAKMKFK